MSTPVNDKGSHQKTFLQGFQPQTQKMARGLKLRIKEIEELYVAKKVLITYANTIKVAATDQPLCFPKCKKQRSHDVAQ